MRKTIRGGMGIGDALYVQSVCRHLVRKGHSLRVHTAWPDVFRHLDPECKTAPFTRQGIQILAHYPHRKHQPTTQFEDCCLTAGIREPVELKLDWAATNMPLLMEVTRLAFANGRNLPIILVQLPRSPMGRTDGFGAELLPNCKSIQTAIDAWHGRALLVQVGAGRALYNFRNIDLDLRDKTTVTDLLDLASIADGFIGYVSFFVPLAESFDKPALMVWSRKGLKSGLPFIRSITPKKILHKPTSRAVMDDASTEEITEASNALL